VSRQYFMDLLAESPLANLTAVTATTETALWSAAEYTPINARDARPGKIYRVTAGGIVSFATTGTLVITPRLGLTVSGTTLGANAAQTVQGVTVTNAAWSLDFTLVVRTLGVAGANSTVIGTGTFTAHGSGAANTGMSCVFGGTSATVDLTVATGITFGWTLSVAGSITPQYACIQSMN
jgi:hypothetical protein